MQQPGFLLLAVLAAALLAPRPTLAQTGADHASPAPVYSVPIYSVPVYDPARDPAADLAATIALAEREGRRILLEVGGDWCTWCHALDRYVHRNEVVARALAADFVVMKVNYSEENRNEAFLASYPKIRGYPHVFVLEHDGTLLHSQNTGALEKGGAYDDEAFLAFLKRWAPEG